MLFIIDMQNEYVDKEKGKKYVNDSEKIIEGIIDKIKEYEENGHNIFYTIDISIKKMQEINSNNLINNKENINYAEKQSTDEKRWAIEPYDLLKPYLKKHKILKKSYYALAPESLLELQEYFKVSGDHKGIIEFVGVETHLCVLANAVCIQSAFPNSDIIINASLCKSKDKKDHEAALKLMEALGMEIRR